MSTGDRMVICSECGNIYYLLWGGCPHCAQLRKKLPGSTAKFTGTINGEPLSTEQLREFIISQSMTIDRLLALNDEMIDALKKIAIYRIDDHDQEWEQDDDLDYVQMIARKVLD